MDKTVYIVNDSGHDYEDAKRFGDIKFLSTGTMNKFDVNNMYRLFSQRLAGSSPDDYILNTALSQMNQIAAAIFVHMHGRLNLLLFKYENGDPKYIERTIVLDNLTDLQSSGQMDREPNTLSARLAREQDL